MDRNKSKSIKQRKEIEKQKERAKAQQKKDNLKKTNKEKEEVFAGYEELSRLARGIVEEDDNQDIKNEFPDSWAKIAAPDEGTQRKISDKLIAEAKKKSKERMKHCNPEGGNPNHSKEDGRFTSSNSDGSWSIKHPKTSKDCDAGTYRKTGRGRQKVWVKQACGRDSDIRLCGTKDGIRAGRSNVTESEGFESIGSEIEMKLADRLQRIQDREPSFVRLLMFLVEPIVGTQIGDTEKHHAEISEKKSKQSPLKNYSPDEIRNLCKSRYNLMTFVEFLDLLQRIEAAKKGVPQKQV